MRSKRPSDLIDSALDTAKPYNAYSDDVNGGFQRDVNKRSGDVNKVGAQRRWNGNHA